MEDKTVCIEFTINREKKALQIPSRMSALTVIRDILGLTGTKEGCGVGECGACTIEVDGQAINSCLMFGAQLDGCNVLTVEGLEKEGQLHRIQKAFLDNHAVQCGFCTPGILMSTHALFEENANPDDEEITKAIAGNICRCTGYQQIFASIKDACSTKTGNG
ncbi:MAG: (2Fe-2S)-binding protein [Desulfobacterales bacterium RIFOXYA12_FULL_46_15]|nr:MAG: (2Fe-2S)-binding protein [Desulfobacula sp. GWF2_41_7]OGR22746.1 MAG: (2Fe-2S)-binding protein [Desulfobacterales bacterium RIFOXYA12_FULL_46_15]